MIRVHKAVFAATFLVLVALQLKVAFAQQTTKTTIFSERESIAIQPFDADGNLLVRLPGTTAKLRVTSSQNSGEATSWSGSVNDEKSSSFTITKYKGIIYGDLSYSIGRFHFQPTVSGGTEVLRVDEKAVSDKAAGNDMSALLPKVNLRRKAVSNSCVGTATTNSIDIAVYYTPDAKNDAGGLSQIEAEAYHAVAQTNATFISSAINTTLNLVLVKELAINDQLATMPSVLDQVANIGTQILHPEISLDKPKFGFDVAVVLVGPVYWTSSTTYDSGYATPRHNAPYSDPSAGYPNYGDPFYDYYYNLYGSYAVVSREFATSNLTFAHELGHIFGGQHDCGDPDNLPFPLYVYSHGYCDSATETIMSRNLCGTVARSSIWSNGVAPTGSPLNTTCSADMRLTFNTFANRVANYNCENQYFTDVSIKDTWVDDGTVPTKMGTGVLYDSVDVWTRQQNDGLTNPHISQNVKAGQTNYIYTKLRNGGSTKTGNVEIYYADASTNLQWGAGPGTSGGTGNFTLIGTVSNITISANSTQTVTLPWSSFSVGAEILGGHYCLYIRWVSPSDPMQTPEGPSVADNTKNNNNIAWKNLRIIPKPPIAEGENFPGGEVVFLSQGTDTGIRFTAKSEDGLQNKFFDNYSVVLEFDKKTRQALRRNKKRNLGTRVYRSGKVIILSQKGMVTFKSWKADRRGNVRVSFVPKPGRTRQVFPSKTRIELDHFQDGRLVGGYAFKFE
jgi:hypothetical protein